MTTRVKISITVPEDLLRRIDAEAERASAGNRSAVIERWLRRAARGRAEDLLREETIRYYDSRGAEEREEDEALSRALAAASRRVRHDD